MASDKPVISAIVCTTGNRKTLNATLRSLADQQGATDRYEVIVVDNSLGSNWVRQQVSLFGFRYLLEPTPGLSRARNAGVEASHGDIVAFIDDDAIANEKWLVSLLARFRATSAAAVGGPIRPIWPDSGSKPLPETLWAYLSILDLGTKAKRLSFPQHPFGCNMAFRKHVLCEVGGFPESLGRVGDRLIGGEETAVFWRLYRVNMEVWYEPDAYVYHLVDPERLSRDWLRRRAYEGGLSIGMLWRIERIGWPFFLRVCLGALARVIQFSIGWLLTRDNKGRVANSIKLADAIGRLVGLVRPME